MDRSASKASVINLDDPVDPSDPYLREPSEHVFADEIGLLAVPGSSAFTQGSNPGSSGLCSPHVEEVPGPGSLGLDQGVLIQDVIEQLESQCVLEANPHLEQEKIIGVPQQQQGPIMAPCALSESFSIEESTKFHQGANAKPKVALTQKKSEGSKMQNPEDRRRCAWIPNQKTEHILQTLPPLDRRLSYTMPGILTEGKMSDPVMELVKKHLGDVVVAPKRIETPDESLAGIFGLLQSGNFRAAIDLSGRLLSGRSQGWGKAHTPSKHTEETLTLWTHRFQLLMGIRYYSLACSEMEAFGDLEAADLYFQYYPETYHNRRGTLVPFSLRLLHAEMPRFSGNAVEALSTCNHVIAVIKRMQSNLNRNLTEDGKYEIDDSDRVLSLQLWTQRLRDAQYCLARTLLSMKEYQLSVSVYGNLADSATDKEEKSGIYSLLGRLGLQLGDFQSATSWFQKFNATCDHNSARMKALACLHKGFLSIFYGNYTDAGQAFQAALQFEPNNCDACNNLSVCLLYDGKLEEAIETLEKIVRDSLEMALREGICTNLCTLYELATARSSGRKQALLNMVAQSRGDSFTTASLKL